AIAAITADRQPAGTKRANGSGCVGVTARIVSSNEAAVNNVEVDVRCGPNTWTVTGPAASGGVRFSVSEKFTVSCLATAGTALSGANVVRWTLVALVLIGLGSTLVVA